VISDLIRPGWTWVLWSWRRLAITVCVLCVIIGTASRAAQGPGSRPRHSAHQVAHAQRPAPAPAISGAALAAAVRAGRMFARTWVSHRPGWAEHVRRYATPRLAARVTAGEQAYLPATAVTGLPTVIRETAVSVTVLVPTNAGQAAVTVVRSGTGWLADAVHLTRVGD
jgi:hypothetical protein